MNLLWSLTIEIAVIIVAIISRDYYHSLSLGAITTIPLMHCQQKCFDSISVLTNYTHVAIINEIVTILWHQSISRVCVKRDALFRDVVEANNNHSPRSNEKE